MVWVVPQGSGQRCVVVGYDAAASSEAALAYAGGCAEHNRGAAVIVHVDAPAGATLAQCACAMVGDVAPDPRRLTCRPISPKR